jgi:hypothetical protein
VAPVGEVPQTDLVVGTGSGGVGTIAIQLAKHLGATVATTTSTANVDWVKSLGADVVVGYRKDDFVTGLSDYDVVLDSLGGETLEKSLTVVKPGGLVIGIGGPPDPDFAKDLGAPWFLRMAMTLLSRRIRMRAKRRGVSTRFCSCGPAGRSCESSPRSSTTDTSARSWTGSSRSTRRSRRSRTSTRGAPRARSSSRWTRAKPRRRTSATTLSPTRADVTPGLARTGIGAPGVAKFQLHCRSGKKAGSARARHRQGESASWSVSGTLVAR